MMKNMKKRAKGFADELNKNLMQSAETAVWTRFVRLFNNLADVR